MPYVSKQQYQEACAADIYAFLLTNHQNDIKIKYGTIQLLNDEHVCVKPGFHGFRNFKTGKPGNNIDLLMEYLGYDYVSAVLALTQGTVVVSIEHALKAVAERPKDVIFPEKCDGPFTNATAYLKSRGIPEEVTRTLIERELLYQDVRRNVVFISSERDYCEIRGTNTYVEKRCAHSHECRNFICGDHDWCIDMAECTNYLAQPFHGSRKKESSCSWCFDPAEDMPKKRIFICEAAIDAISLYVLRRDNQLVVNEKYYSIGGVANQKAIERIAANAGESQVILAVDNDAAGDDCRKRNLLFNCMIPDCKDWNEELRKRDGK